MGKSATVSVQAGEGPPDEVPPDWDWLYWLVPGVILGTVLYIVLFKR